MSRKHISTSNMKNETWDTLTSPSSISHSNLLPPNQRRVHDNPLFKHFELKTPVFTSSKTIKSNNAKTITILPRQSYGSLCSSSNSSRSRSCSSFVSGPPIGASHNTYGKNKLKPNLYNRVQYSHDNLREHASKSTRKGYHLVIMPRESRNKLNS